MAIYLKKFETQSAYEAAQSDLILPNVSLIADNNTMHYSPYDPYNGHEYVDLGLPSGTKWATMNVGANAESDYGNWYKYGLGASPYEINQTNYAGTEDPLATSADTAAQVWGGPWHMPTKAQLDELTANTTYRLATINGVYGGKYIASNDNYIFIPFAGHWYFGSHLSERSKGYIWSSSPSDGSNAFLLDSNNGGKSVKNDVRYIGGSVRPVVG